MSDPGGKVEPDWKLIATLAIVSQERGQIFKDKVGRLEPHSLLVLGRLDEIVLDTGADDSRRAGAQSVSSPGRIQLHGRGQFDRQGQSAWLTRLPSDENL